MWIIWQKCLCAAAKGQVSVRMPRFQTDSESINMPRAYSNSEEGMVDH